MAGNRPFYCQVEVVDPSRVFVTSECLNLQCVQIFTPNRKG